MTRKSLLPLLLGISVTKCDWVVYDHRSNNCDCAFVLPCREKEVNVPFEEIQVADPPHPPKNRVLIVRTLIENITVLVFRIIGDGGKMSNF